MDFTILNSLSSESIIFGGLTLISLSLTLLIYKIIVRYGNHTNNVIDKNTKAWIRHAKSEERSACATERLVETIEKHWNKN